MLGAEEASATTHDLALLPTFTEDAVLSNLEQRYGANQIYTSVNAMLIAINPYADLGLYAPSVLRQYGRLGAPKPAPHAFAVAADAYAGLLGGASQSVLVTGESGAGKTETCRRILQYLASAQCGRPGAGEGEGGAAERDGTAALHAELLSTNCVLEALGNARTVMNDNSSRFGKFLLMRYDGAARLAGADVSTYLLERTRVVGHAPGERTFHVFYALLAGLSPAQLAELSLDSNGGGGGGGGAAGRFRYTAASAADATRWARMNQASLDAEAQRDARTLDEVGRALEAAGVGSYVLWQVWRALAAVLHLGELSFSGEEAELDRACEEHLRIASSLLGLDLAALRHALVTRCIKAGSEFISTPNSSAAASELRDGLAKALYARLFGKLLGAINGGLARGGGGGGMGGSRFIGVLDIFGFEIFETNSLEQVPPELTSK